MKTMVLLGLACVFLIGCGPALPDGYSIIHGDRGKAWLANPDGTLAHGAVIKRLYRGDERLLLITFPETLGGDVQGPARWTAPATSPC